MGYSKNKLKRLRYSLKSNCNRLSKKLYAIDEAVLYDYVKREDSYVSSEYNYLKAPNKRPLRDARVKFNDFGIIKLARVINSTYDDIKLAIKPIRYITRQIEIKPQPSKKVEFVKHKINQKLEATRFRSMSEYVKLLNQIEAV